MMDSNLVLTLEPRQCQVCHTRADLQRCGGCKVVFYCSREHQASHRDSHKHACTVIRKGLTAVGREDHTLRTGQHGGFFARGNVFENSAGHFWGIPETRDYMIARFHVVDDTLAHFKNIDAVQTSLNHLTDMLRLCRGDNLGIRQIVPALYLRLGRDQECYDFVKWWATTAHKDDAWRDDMEHPYLDLRDADVLESPEGLWDGDFMQLSHSTCVVLIKVRILLDLQHMQNATRAFQGAIPRELIDEIRGRSLVSSVVASRKDIVLASVERTAELVQLIKGQIRMLFDVISSYSPTFWSTLIDHKRPERILEAYTKGSKEEATLMTGYNYDAWRETPGAVGLIKSLMRSA